MSYTESELRATGETPINRAIMSLRAAHDAYIAMAFDAASRKDAWGMCHAAKRACAHGAEADRLDREVARMYR
jgi:hypothetical protein